MGVVPTKIVIPVPSKVVIPAKAGIQEYLGFLSSYTGIVITITMVLSLFCAPAGAAIKPGTLYAEGNLTMEVQNASLNEILEAIARTAGVDVFVARGFLPGGRKMSLKIAGEPLDDVLRQVLRGYNYAAIYVKEGEDFRVASIKIYPEGQQGGETIPLFSGGRTPLYEEKGRRGETVTVMVSSGGTVISTSGRPENKGLLAPSRSSLNPGADTAALSTPWFALQTQLESEEASQYHDLMLLQKRLEAAEDPALKRSLTMIYADQLAKFHTAKKANLNKIEALKRITQFREMTGK